MTVTMAIHEVKDHLSSVIAKLAETGEEVAITKHGRIVARLMAAHPAGVVLGLGASAGVETPSLEDLRWDDGELAGMVDGPALPA
jgi:prevent-host-death family protein